MAMQLWPRIPPEMMKYASAGLEFTIIFVAFVFGGLWLDRRSGTNMIFTLVGAAAGFAVATYRIVRLAREFGKKQDDSTKKQGQ